MFRSCCNCPGEMRDGERLKQSSGDDPGEGAQALRWEDQQVTDVRR